MPGIKSARNNLWDNIAEGLSQMKQRQGQRVNTRPLFSNSVTILLPLSPAHFPPQLFGRIKWTSGPTRLKPWLWIQQWKVLPPCQRNGVKPQTRDSVRVSLWNPEMPSLMHLTVGRMNQV